MAKEKVIGETVILAVRNLRKSIRIVYSQGADDFDVNYHDNPLPAFLKALRGLDEHVLSLCELPKSDLAKIEATGITVRAKGEAESALIVARKKIRKGKRIFNVSTPLLAMYSDPNDESVDCMDEKEAAAIEKVIKEAKRYIAGERAQGQIEFEEEGSEKKEDKDKTAPLTLLEEPGSEAQG